MGQGSARPPEPPSVHHECPRVSCHYNHLPDSSTVWRLKCENEGRTDIIRAASCHGFCWQCVYMKNPFGRNLLRNPCGTEGLRNWEVGNGGDGWAVEKNHSHLEGAESQTCFVSSFFWCKKGQVIHLLREGLWEHLLDVHQPIIRISDWYAVRHDSGCVYEIQVQLLAADQKTVIQEYTEKPPIEQNMLVYRQVYHEFRGYGPGVRYVNFVHSGKHTKFRKGWYGARITNSSVIIKFDNIVDLDPFPDELLLLIFSYVPARDLIFHCRSVSHRWKHLVDSSTVWRLKCEREERTDIIRAASCHGFCWQRVYMKNPFGRNLLRNPCGTEGLTYWEATNGGDGWVIEDNYSHLEGATSQRCFVSSFFWCKKGQVIDLLREGLWEHLLDAYQPIICISDWYAGRRDCGCVYEMRVQLLAADQKTVIQEYSENPPPIPQWNDSLYKQVYHEFRRYGRGVRYVNFVHRGRDTQFWKGWYGARITNSSVIIKCDNIGPCSSLQRFLAGRVFEMHLGESSQ